MDQNYLWGNTQKRTPLASRMRPRKIGDILGQEHILSEKALLGRAIEKDELFSSIFYGPPGCGKTTVGEFIGSKTRNHFLHFSAAKSTMSSLKPVLENATERFMKTGIPTIVFVDEIHRFNKLQQDVLLPYIESGEVILIGATTENPSFELNPALLSRCKIFTFRKLTNEHIENIVRKGIEIASDGYGIITDPDAMQAIIDWSAGDARTAINYIDIIVPAMISNDEKIINSDAIQKYLQQSIQKYRKNGDEHYDLISAFIKSMRGSDPDAAIYYMSRMLQAGEDPLYVARRIVRFASEDIGLAEPNAMGIAVSAFQACKFIGMPECSTSLAQAAVYMAISPKSNRIYLAYNEAAEEVSRHPDLPVPLKLRNPVTKFMKDSGYGKDYHYAHSHKNAFWFESYLPEGMEDVLFYKPSDFGKEKKIKEYLEKLWKREYDGNTKEG